MLKINKFISYIPKCTNTLTINAPINKEIFYKNYTFLEDDYTQFLNKYNQSLIENIPPRDQDTSKISTSETATLFYEKSLPGSNINTVVPVVTLLDTNDSYSFITSNSTGSYQDTSKTLHDYLINSTKYIQTKTLLRASQNLSNVYLNSILEGEKEFSIPRSINLTGTLVLPPAIVYFLADPNPIDDGNNSTLSWKIIGNTTNIYITWTYSGSHTISSLDKIGTTIINIPDTITFTLHATGPGGTVTQDLVITGNTVIPLPEISSFSALRYPQSVWIDTRIGDGTSLSDLFFVETFLPVINQFYTPDNATLYWDVTDGPLTGFTNIYILQGADFYSPGNPILTSIALSNLITGFDISTYTNPGLNTFTLIANSPNGSVYSVVQFTI